MILNIKHTEVTNGDYGEYLKVTGMDTKGTEKYVNVGKKFDDKWHIIEKGATINFHNKQVDGKWRLEGFDVAATQEDNHLVEEAKKMGATVEKSTPKYKADPDKTSSIEKQVCLKAAVDLCIADKIKPSDIIPNMREFFKEF